MAPQAGAAIALLVVLLGSGCVARIAEPRVRAALLDAGLSPRNAACMAGRMTERLSIGQLRRLEALRAEKRSLGDYVATVRRLSDAELLGVTVSSAALCTARLDR